MPAFADFVTIGRVIKPQGRHGEMAVACLSDHPQRFTTLKRAWVEGPGGEPRAVTITNCWPHKGRFVLKLAGVDSINDAERYRGLDLRLPEADLPVLPAGSYYHHQLEGIAVEDEAGHPLGVVASVLHGAGDAPVLTIRGDAGETMIPLAEAWVRQVDVEHRRMVVRAPEWLNAHG